MVKPLSAMTVIVDWAEVGLTEVKQAGSLRPIS